MRRPLLGLAFLLLAAVAGCKQGAGERCQIDDDCEDGLVCSESQHICQMNVPTVDAAPRIDARVVDASTLDAAGPDAAGDAAAIDGPPVDAP